MKILKIEIKNFRSLKSVVIYPKDLQALVGKNNSGKSSFMKSLQILFEGSTTLISEDCFFDNDTTLTIEIFATFSGLSIWESEQFAGYVYDDKLTVGRKITMNQGSATIITVGLKKKPTQEWLRIENINTQNLNIWWDIKETLIVQGVSISTYLQGKRKTVVAWKEAVEQFLSENSNLITLESVFEENPKGYANVLKGAFPEFIYVPAVRDIADEAKVSKTNPFGQLIGSIMEKLSDGQTTDLETKIQQIELVLNRNGGNSRLEEIKNLEKRLNELMRQIMPCDIEIEISMPKLKDVVGAAKVYADDGVRTLIDTKGNGLQRSMIFTILRAYAELSHIRKAQDRHNQRNTIFVIEEPELYLHPQSQRTLFQVLRTISESRDQVIYNTHSTLFLDIAYFDEVCVVKKIEEQGKYITKPVQLTMQQLLIDLRIRHNVTGTEEGIREQYFNVFNPIINEGFFADKVMIVEGDSEQYSFPIYSSTLGFDLDQHNVAIVHSNGKGQIDRLLRIFNGFEIPTYVWFDGDKNNIETEIINKSLELLTLLRNPLADISQITTIVSEHFTILEETFESTLQSEISDYQTYMRRATTAMGECGKPLKHRYIARVIKQLVKDGGVATDLVPPTIQAIVEKIKNLQFMGTVLRS